MSVLTPPGERPNELARWLAGLLPSEMLCLLAELAIREPHTFEASRRRVGEYLRELTPDQRRAVLAADGAPLVRLITRPRLPADDS